MGLQYQYFQKARRQFLLDNGHRRTGARNHKVPKSTKVIIQEGPTKYLRMSLKPIKLTDWRFIQVKVVAITGSCRIFASRFDMYPNQFDFEDSVEFTNEHFLLVHTSEKKT